MPQVLKRLACGLYVLVDTEVIILTTPTTSYGSVDLIGTAVRTKNGWRCLRWGLVDVGYRPNELEAVDLLLREHERIGRPRTTAQALEAVADCIDPKTKKAMPT